MNAVVMAVLIMVVLSLGRVHVVLALICGAVIGGLLAGLPLAQTLSVFEDGVQKGASIALSYAMLGALAMAIAHSGAPNIIAQKLTQKLTNNADNKHIKWWLLLVIGAFAVSSQNLIPIHIAFVPLIIPPLLLIFNRLQLDRRLIACLITFGLVNTYMFIPYGFGDIFINQIILQNINDSGVNTDGINIYKTMFIPALGMFFGLLIALFFSYKKPRRYIDITTNNTESTMTTAKISPKKALITTTVALIAALMVQIYAGSLLIGALVGFVVFMAAGVVNLSQVDEVFNKGITMMAMIGFIMIAAQGFAEVMKATGHIDALVSASMNIVQGNKAIAVLIMLIVGLLVTMGIGSSFSTVPIIASIYVPICVALGMSMPATVAVVAVAGVLGDAGSPASDSTLGPTMGLNADGQHDHIKDSVIPTFIHYNIPLIIFGWIAAMVL